MLEGIFFKKGYRSFKAKDMILVNPGVNMLVGDQGAGKSTLIELIRGYGVKDEASRTRIWRSVPLSKKETAETVTVLISKPMRVFARDFERDSGRMASEIQDDLALQLFEMKHSHGEGVREWTRMLERTLEAPGRQEAVLALLDEPDANLSPRSCYGLVRLLRKIASGGGQVVAAVHNPILITGRIPGDKTPGWDFVIDVGDGCKRKPPKDYLRSQAGP